ncbi:MAG TPA: hypothetical protein VGJ02_06370 [Pyrinomonadaceae bacterium]|jgi:hypothetical protein
MKQQFTLAILTVVAIVMVAACSVFKNAANTGAVGQNTNTNEAPAQPEAGTAKAQTDQQIRSVDFKDFTYQPDCAGEESKKVTVKNGDFSSEKQEDGYVDHFDFRVTSVSYGDLNGDNSEEAIVLTVCNTGGTGNFSEGFIYSLKDGKPALFATIPGGDRADGGLRTARVENGQLVVEANDPGPGGGACCPEFAITARYDVSSGKLKQIGKEDKRSLFPSRRVSFAKGTSGTTINVKIPSDEGRRYVIGARAGQTLDVSVNTDKASVRLLDDEIQTEDKTNGFTVVLPKDGDFTIEVDNAQDGPVDVTVNIRIR